MDGGPPVRGTKLTAWQIPPIWNDLQGDSYDVPENSRVPQKQEILLRATEKVLEEIAKDVRGGLLETVGIESYFSIDEGKCSMVLELPDKTDTKLIAEAIDAENLESWCDAQGKVHVAISPWYSTKDVDQIVLSATKIIHVMLGLHASDSAQPKTLKQKLLSSIQEIMQIQRETKR